MFKKSFTQLLVLSLLIVLATACGGAGADKANSNDVNECVKTGVSKADCEKLMKDVADLQKK